MPRELSVVVEEILSHEGAALEKRDDGSLEFLLPPNVSETLGLPEHGRLSFSVEKESEGALTVSYESELFRALEKLFSGKGRLARAFYPSSSPNIEKISKGISEKVVLSNATFRLQKVSEETNAYLLIYFQYQALSDEKREGLLSLLVSLKNFSAVPLEDPLAEFGSDLVDQKQDDGKESWDGTEFLRAFEAGYEAACAQAKEVLGPFLQSLEKRLHRDIRRVHDYYEDLKRETERAFEKRRTVRPESPPGPNGEDLSQEVAQRALLEKLEAIEAEKHWKVQDLVSKYALTVRVEPVCGLLVETHAPVFWIEIKRRLSSRAFPVGYNPMLKRLDPLPCEACYNPRGGTFVCDDQLHLLCSQCFKKCLICGRPYCSACSRKGCPRCGRNGRKGA